MSADQVVLVCLAPVLLGAVAALVTDAFSLRRTAIALALLGLAAGAALCVWSAASVAVTDAWGVLRVGGPFSSVGVVVNVTGMLALLGGWSQFSERQNGGTLAALVAFSALASVVVATSRDVTLLLISLETAAVCAYALVAATRTRESSEAAMKYLIQGAVATGFLLLGIGVLVAMVAPDGDLNAISSAFSNGTLYTVAIVGVVSLLSVLAFKAGAAPFHSWAPDVYQTTSPEVTAFLSTGPKVAAITAFTVILELVASDVSQRASSMRATASIAMIVSIMAIASVVIGSLVALRQRSYTRMLAYAGIAQAGYALIGASSLSNPSAAAFFVSTYALATVGTFLAAAAFHRVDPAWDGSIAGLAGMGRRAPLLSASLVVLLLSLAGIPPLLGFWAKLVVFGSALTQASAAFAAGMTTMGWTSALSATVGIVGSVVSLGYYGSVLRALYLLPAEATDTADQTSSTVNAEGGQRARFGVFTVALLALTVVGLGLIPMLWGLAPLVSPFVPR